MRDSKFLKTLAGQRFGITVLIDVWRISAERRQAQLKLGLLYCASVAAVLLVLAAATADSAKVRFARGEVGKGMSVRVEDLEFSNDA